MRTSRQHCVYDRAVAELDLVIPTPPSCIRSVSSGR